jgi:hypothetical protein
MNANGQHVLKTLEKLFKKYRVVLSKAADTIRLQNVSNYPIFVASQEDIEIGIPLLRREQIDNQWLINASTLEEFNAKQIITTDRIDDFRHLYKSHGEDICIFAYTEGVGKFLFISG